MTHTRIRKMVPALCILIILIITCVVVCSRPHRYPATIPTQGVFSNSAGKSDSAHEEETVHFSLIDTGKYYIMTADGAVKESGRCYMDEDGFGHLQADQDDQIHASENGYFICIDANKFLLISRGGELIYMRQIDEGGRVPASEAE